MATATPVVKRAAANAAATAQDAAERYAPVVQDAARRAATNAATATVNDGDTGAAQMAPQPSWTFVIGTNAFLVNL